MQGVTFILIGLALGGNGRVLGQPGGPTFSEHALNEAEQAFVRLADAYLEKYRSLQVSSSRAWWEASITGTDEAFQHRKDAETAPVNLHSDRAMFARDLGFESFFAMQMALQDIDESELFALPDELDVLTR